MSHLAIILTLALGLLAAIWACAHDMARRLARIEMLLRERLQTEPEPVDED